MRTSPLLFALLLAFGTLQAAEPPPAKASALNALFELGLPEARGGRWVNATIPALLRDLMPARGAGLQSLTGNAWVLSEDKQHHATLLLKQSKVVHVRLVTGEELQKIDAGVEEPTERELIASIKPADLEADCQTIIKLLDGLGEEGSPLHPEMGRDEAQSLLGQLMLLAAQLQRQRNGNAEALLNGIANSPSPQMAQEGAIELLAGAKMEELTKAWYKGSSPEAYASGLEALAAKFHRGWQQRDAVLLLAQKARATAAPASLGPAASMLGKLDANSAQELPLDRNWLLEEFSNAEGPAHRRTPAPPRGRRSVRPQAIAALSEWSLFFSRGVSAAQELAPLMDQTGLLRVAKQNGYNYHFSYGRQDPAEKLKAEYDSLERPYEVGELVAACLKGIIPEDPLDAIERTNAKQKEQAVEWLNSIAKLDREGLAWTYLQQARQPQSESFRNALSYLVEKGSPGTIEKLKNVFFDPAIWERGMMEALQADLRMYLERLGSSKEDFGKQLIAILQKSEKTADEDEDEEPIQTQQGEQPSDVKLFEQILHPRTLDTILADYIKASPEEAKELIGTLPLAVESAAESPVEAAILQAAARCTSGVKRLMLIRFLYSQIQDAQSSSTAKPLLLDEQTSQAVLELLKEDKAPAEDEEQESEETPVPSSDYVSYVVLQLTTDPPTLQRVQELGRRQPMVAQKWTKMAVKAMLAHDPIPPLPTFASATPEDVKTWSSELPKGNGAAVLAVLDAWPLQRQVALSNALLAMPKWPQSLVEAQLTLHTVNAPKSTALSFAKKWEGRQLSAEMLQEIQRGMAEHWRGSGPLSLSISSSQPASGAVGNLQQSPRKMSQQMLSNFSIAGLEGKPPPDGVAVLGVRLFVDGKVEQAFQSIPWWKDGAIMEAWEREQGQTTGGQSVPATTISKAGPRSSPEEVFTILQKIFTGDPKSLSQFFISYQQVSIVEGDE